MNRAIVNLWPRRLKPALYGCDRTRAERDFRRAAQAADLQHAVPSYYSAVAFCSGRATMTAATPEAQKRRSGQFD